MPRYRTILYALLIVALALLANGCSGGSQRTVSGNVSYQGEPVAQGEIVFADAGNAAASSFGRIENGKYSLQTTPGEKKVRITASKETGKMIKGGMDEMVPERVDLIPQQYNSESTLVRTVNASGSTVIDFALE